MEYTSGSNNAVYPNEIHSVLDHGYVTLIETWGSDERIIESARMSTNKGFQGWGKRNQCEYCGLSEDEMRNTSAWMECTASGTSHSMGPFGPAGDEKLLKYLYEHKHMTPFEMCGMTIEVQAPIFVFREWHRHRTQSYNEMSSRYTELPNLFYLPSFDRLRQAKQSKTNKQGSAQAEFTDNELYKIQKGIDLTYQYARESYEGMIRLGVAREIARLVIPVAQYSRMRASANLRNWLAFLTLRQDTAAQWEIRQFANEVAKLVERNFPRTYQLYVDSSF